MEKLQLKWSTKAQTTQEPSDCDMKDKAVTHCIMYKEAHESSYGHFLFLWTVVWWGDFSVCNIRLIPSSYGPVMVCVAFIPETEASIHHQLTGNRAGGQQFWSVHMDFTLKPEGVTQ